MKIKVNTEELKSAVQEVIPALAAKAESSTKVYEFIHISTHQDTVVFRCFNMYMQIETKLFATVEEEGEMLVPGKLFAEIVAKLPKDETTLEKTDETAKIKSGSMNMKLQTLPASSFEGISVSSSDNTIKIQEVVLKKMILQTSPFALQDNTRPILKGVLVEVIDDELKMVAMEPLKFAMRKEKVINESKQSSSIIITSKLLENAARVLSESNENISLIFSKQSLTIETAKTTIIMLKLDGNYLDYKAFLPANYVTRVRLSRKEFISVAERAYLVARDDKKNTVKMIFEDGKVTVIVDNEIGSVNDSAEAFITGSSITICFNIKNFLDVVKIVEDDDIIFEMTVPRSPCVVKPVDGEGFLYLVLPMIVN